MPKVSVVIPVYNVEEYLHDCLDSILDANATDFEVVAVNDGSTDKSGQILDIYAAKDARVRVIHKQNEGNSIARNTGFEQSTGEYILFVDSDDMIVPDTIPLSVQAIERSGADVVLFDFQHIAQDGRPGSVFSSMEEPTFQNRMLDDRFEVTMLIQASPWCKLYSRAFLEDHKLRFTPDLWFEDLLFCLQMVACRPQIYYLPQSFYLYRQRAKSITKSIASPRNHEIISVFEKAIEYYEEKDLYTVCADLIEHLAYTHIKCGVLYIVAKADNRELFRSIMDDYRRLFPNDKRNPYRFKRTRKQRIIAHLIEHERFRLIRAYSGLKKS